MLGDLHWAGYEVTEDHASADAIIVNTCAFVEDAKSESLEVGFSSFSFPPLVQDLGPQACDLNFFLRSHLGRLGSLFANKLDN